MMGCITPCVRPTWRYTGEVGAHREAWHAAGDSQEEKVRCLGHVARAKGTTANTIVEGNIGGKITRQDSKKVVERCKGVDMAELELVEEKARGPCGLDKACQLCFNDGFD